MIAWRRKFRLAGFLARLKTWRARLGFGWGRNLKYGESSPLGDDKVRLPLNGGPIEIIMGRNDKILHLYRESRLDERGERAYANYYILVDPVVQQGRISGFLRLPPRSWLSLGSGDALQQAIFRYPETVAEEQVVVIHGRDALVFRNLGDTGTAIGPALQEDRWGRIGRYRRLREIFDGPIQIMLPGEALVLIEKVNRLMRDDAYRPYSDCGLPGGLLKLPPNLTPILVADMHGQADNLLTVLSQNAFLDAMEAGNAALVILGDAAHCELDGRLHEMASSVLLMDLIFKLKLRFPRQVFYLRGNHDSFSDQIVKDGVSQGLLWAKELVERRGPAYLRAMQDFYEHLPFVAMAQDFVACHAGAPLAKVSQEMFINIHRHPDLVHELINNRPRRPNRPQGYSRRDVKRLRNALGLAKRTPFIVGHTPLDPQATLWLDIEGIAGHHVLFSAHPEQVGVFTRVGNTMVPLVYPVDAATAIINGFESDSR